ncbi:protein ACCELERATED CELL DEATH 6-like [Silene latifolia]|uniref:protein ACCELERATED CELL DEATH 6-like n=1 Tax=Silene latifolia TaxID=37657 RepID=UPI003D777D8F
MIATDIVDRILEIDTSSLLIRVKNDQGQTPLHCCAAQNVKEQRMILRALLDQDDKYNSAAYIQDNEGRTPLRIATLNSNFNGAKILIRSYPDCIEIVDNKGQNMVHLAANLGCIDKFRLFLRKAPKCDKLINEKDDEGNTPLHLLVATAPYLSITGVKFLLTRQRNLDVRAFNNKNLTAGDIIAAKDGLLPLDASTRNRRTSLIPEGKRIIPDVSKTEVAETTNTMNNNVVLQNKGSSEIEDRISRYKKMEETHLVVAALIATVSFAAAFTLPGGFDQSPGENIGLALLAKKTSFMVFLVSDTIAFTMSSIAVICYFSMASRSKSKSNLKGVETLSMVAYAFTTISLGALMLTFVTGVYTMVSRSSGLTSTVIVISLYYFILYLGLCVGSWRALWACSQRF